MSFPNEVDIASMVEPKKFEVPLMVVSITVTTGTGEVIEVTHDIPVRRMTEDPQADADNADALSSLWSYTSKEMDAIINGYTWRTGTVNITDMNLRHQNNGRGIEVLASNADDLRQSVARNFS